MNKKSTVAIFTLVCLISIATQIYFRYGLSLNRYFDIDEFAHLHWAYSFFAGGMPYRDYFYFFPPYFLMPLGIVFSLFGRSVQSLIAARGFIFLVQISAYIVLFFWIKKLRNSVIALLTLAVFIFLPLPSDKLLEIRPDLLASVAALLGLYVFVTAIEKNRGFLYFLSGFLISLSLAVVPKTVFFFVPPAIVLVYKFLTLKRQGVRDFWHKNLLLLSGFAVNAVVVAGFFAYSGKFWLAIYSVTSLASRIAQVLGSKFFMRPDLFFYPNDTYYGMPGLSQTLLVNLFIYIAGCVWGIKALVSSFSDDDNNKNIREFIFAGAFMINLYAFVMIYPLKHLQYLIPVSFFAAFYFAEFLKTVAFKLNRRTWELILIPVVVYITYLGFLMYEYKLPWNNKPFLTNLASVLENIPAASPVFDLTGETIFYRDGYYFCCIPYGQYEEVLNFAYQAPSLELPKRGTEFVNVGKTDRLEVLPVPHAKYIKENYPEKLQFGTIQIWKKP